MGDVSQGMFDKSRHKINEYWIFAEILHGINEENIIYLSGKNIRENNIIFYYETMMEIWRQDLVYYKNVYLFCVIVHLF